MEHKNIDIVCIHALERTMDCIHDMSARMALIVLAPTDRITALGGQDQFLAQPHTVDDVADDFFVNTGRIKISQVDKIDPFVDRMLDDRFAL